MLFRSLASRMALFIVLAVGVILYLAFAAPFQPLGYAQIVEDKIPPEQVYLKDLANQLVIHNEKVYDTLKTDVGSIRSIGWYMSNYPEEFNAPSAWFERVAQTAEIPASSVQVLLLSAKTGPISTDEAADWLLEVSQSLKNAESAQSQQTGVQVLRDTYFKSIEAKNNKE